MPGPTGLPGWPKSLRLAQSPKASPRGCTGPHCGHRCTSAVDAVRHDSCHAWMYRLPNRIGAALLALATTTVMQLTAENGSKNLQVRGPWLVPPLHCKTLSKKQLNTPPKGRQPLTAGRPLHSAGAQCHPPSVCEPHTAKPPVADQTTATTSVPNMCAGCSRLLLPRALCMQTAKSIVPGLSNNASALLANRKNKHTPLGHSFSPAAACAHTCQLARPHG
jgi:hypothetical protein